MIGARLLEKYKGELQKGINDLKFGRIVKLQTLVGGTWNDLTHPERQQLGIAFYDAVAAGEFGDIYPIAGLAKPEQKYVRAVELDA